MSAPTEPGQETEKHVSLREATLFWLKLGCISFGGPAGQIALMHEEVVRKRRWVSEARFLHALNYCMVLPGPEAQQLATYLGWLLHRTTGGVVAGALFVLPSLVLLLGLSWVYVRYGNTPYVAGPFAGVKPAMAVIVAHAALRLGARILRHPVLWLFAVGALVGAGWFNLPFPALLLSAGLLGLAGARLKPEVFVSGSGEGGAGPSGEACFRDSAVGGHIQFRWARLAKALGAGLLCWAIPMGVLYAWAGGGHPWTNMGMFFTKAALLTFGGAYAVLPYVMQAAVGQFGWISPREMLDGLALGESTPGPLIMVVVFVAFLGGVRGAPAGVEYGASYGLGAALVTVWFTFLPSFVFILAGGPVVESTRHLRALTGPLTAMRAATVGAIVHLALLLAGHVLWPAGFGQAPDWRACLIACGAAVALFGFKRSVLEVIGWSALAGFLL